MTELTHYINGKNVKGTSGRFAEARNPATGEVISNVPILSKEHGKTIPDSKGDIQRGLEVVEVCMGVPAMTKGEYTGDAGAGIDLYSIRQPLGVVAGITPFNFPAMIPLWKMAPAIACGNAIILKPSERTPNTSMRLAELFMATKNVLMRSSTMTQSKLLVLLVQRLSRSISMDVRQPPVSARSASVGRKTT